MSAAESPDRRIGARAPVARAPRLAWVAAAALALGAFVALTPLGAWLSRPLADAQLRWAAPRQAPADVLLVNIDDASLALLKPLVGPWPFKRDLYALVVDLLREDGAKAIAIDLLLADSHAGDAALARAIARPGAPVVLAAAGLQHASDIAPRVAAAATSPREPPATRWPSIALPAETLWPGPATPPPWLGVITTPLDDDGSLRRLPLWHEAHGQRWPAFSLAVLQATSAQALAAERWPLDGEGRLGIAFPIAPMAQVPLLPFSRLAQAALGGPRDAGLAEAVRGRVVFIGSSALLADNVLTPAGQLSGTAALAYAYATLRDGRGLAPPHAGWQALLLALALAPALWAWRRGTTLPRRDGVTAMVALSVIVGLSSALLLGGGQRSELAAPLVALGASLALLFAAHQRWLARCQRRMAYEHAVAAAANQAKSEFLANVSHEIRTPINAMLGVAELLAESELTPQQQRHVEVFRSAGHNLFELINELLDLSKIEAGRLELHDAPFALRPMLESCMALLRPRAEQKGLALRLEIDESLPAAVLADRQRLGQALTNLLGNAIKFTAEGEVRLAVTRQADGGEARLRCTVIDTGIGIAPSKLETIFEPFTQADGSVTRIYGGTGLGLAITRSLAQLMGGQITVQSAPGRGSEFQLDLPLREAAVPQHDAGIALAARAAVPATLDAPLSLLLAEDNDVNVYLFEAMVAGTGVTVDVARNGQVAVEKFRAGRYDMVFLDMQMPVMDGLTAAREMRRIEQQLHRPPAPLIALTANAYQHDMQASLDAGCNAHLSKPVAKDLLLRTIGHWRAPGRGSAHARAAAMHADAPVTTTDAALDRAAALARLSGDAALYRRVCEHATTFLEGWSASFDAATRHGDAEQAKRVAHDLNNIAGSIGATALSAAAAQLEIAIGRPPSLEDAAAIAHSLYAVRTAMGPVLLELTQPA